MFMNYVIMMILVCYDANVLAKIEQEMKTIKVNLQHWISRREHVVLQIWILGMQVCRLRIVICIMVMSIPFIVLMLGLYTL